MSEYDNPIYHRYTVCACCGHLGRSHSAQGGCLAQVARKRSTRDCPCRVFIPMSEASRAEGIFQINTKGLGLRDA